MRPPSGADRSPSQACGDFAQEGYVCASINYRFLSGADNTAWPVYDARTAVRFLRKNASTYNIDPDRIGAIGWSAGAWSVSYLAFSTGSDSITVDSEGARVSLDPSNLPYRDISARLQATIMISGAIDASGSLARRTADELPPAMTMAGTSESGAYKDKNMATRLAEMGVPAVYVPMEGLNHAPDLRGYSRKGDWSWNYVPLVLEFWSTWLGKAPVTAAAPYLSGPVRSSLRASPTRVHGHYSVMGRRTTLRPGRILADAPGAGVTRRRPSLCLEP